MHTILNTLKWTTTGQRRDAAGAGPAPWQPEPAAFLQFADRVDDVCWLYEPASARFTYVSPAYERLWGGSAGALLAGAAAWLDPVHPDDRAALRGAWQRLPEEGGYALDYRRTDRHGRERWISERAQPAAAVRGAAPQVAGVSCDITAARCAELALDAADRRRDELLAVLAHELRAPLQSIQAAADLLSGTQGPSVKIIGRQVDRLARLIDDLGEATRSRQGKSQLRCVPVVLRGVVQVAIDDQRALYNAAGLQLRLHAPAHDIWVHADAARLAQVFGNLLHNAAKFSAPRGTVNVTLHHAPGAGEVAVTVQDDGVGIASAEIDSVFDLFSQGATAPVRLRSGLGIGLSVVRSLVEQHGGRVSVRSAGRGSGSRFQVTLPAVAARASPRHRRVLLVEDDADAASSMRLLLEQQGHVVAQVGTGRAALERAGTWRPDTVLMDLGLPDMDGADVARSLRRAPPVPGLRLIALSGAVADGTRQALQAAGFDDCLVKPADLRALAALLDA